MTYHVPPPELAVVQFRLELAGPTLAPHVIVCHATGSSPMRRRSLWTESSIFGEDADLRHAPADWIHHIALTALQDRPNSQERLLFGLTGGLGIQESLF